MLISTLKLLCGLYEFSCFAMFRCVTLIVLRLWVGVCLPICGLFGFDNNVVTLVDLFDF